MLSSSNPNILDAYPTSKIYTIPQWRWSPTFWKQVIRGSNNSICHQVKYNNSVLGSFNFKNNGIQASTHKNMKIYILTSESLFLLFFAWKTAFGESAKEVKVRGILEAVE